MLIYNKYKASLYLNTVNLLSKNLINLNTFKNINYNFNSKNKILRNFIFLMSLNYVHSLYTIIVSKNYSILKINFDMIFLLLIVDLNLNNFSI